jgi:uncharacterized membrane protein (DUF2068 family)
VIIETASFLPLEIWDILHRFQPLSWVTLAVNVAVLIYVTHLYRQRPRRQA